MLRISGILLCGVLALAASVAEAQNPMRIRGTISSVDGDLLMIKTREGRDMKIEIDAKTTYAYPKALKLADIKPGTPMGTTAVTGADGKLVAREVHVFPADRPVPNEGHRPWDLEPNSSMTNASVSAAVQGANGRELTLTYKGGTQTVIVPENTPVVMAMDGDRTLLKPGEYAYIQAAMNNDGKVVASRIQVSKDGVRPPQ
jgi:hypothetical protein